MIYYKSRGIHYFLKVFQMYGSVFPWAGTMALPSSAITAFIRILINAGYLPLLDDTSSMMKDTSAWVGFSTLVGFLIVFRTSQAYSRFCDGCQSVHKMRAEWFDAASALIAFCRHSRADAREIERFKHTIIRLFSMLHAACLADIEEGGKRRELARVKGKSGECELELVTVGQTMAYTYDLLDVHSIDVASQDVLKATKSKSKVIFTWIQMVIVEHIDTGVLSIPAPILSRVFQELANGMVYTYDAMKISEIPFPFPYAQTCDCLLCIHWLVIPFVVSHWVVSPIWAGIFAFTQVFTFWALNFIAVEIDNPFGTDPNDLDSRGMQKEMNSCLLLLVDPNTTKTPELVCDDSELMMNLRSLTRKSTFAEVWSDEAMKQFVDNDVNENPSGPMLTCPAEEANSCDQPQGADSRSGKCCHLSLPAHVMKVGNEETGRHIESWPIGLTVEGFNDRPNHCPNGEAAFCNASDPLRSLGQGASENSQHGTACGSRCTSKGAVITLASDVVVDRGHIEEYADSASEASRLNSSAVSTSARPRRPDFSRPRQPAQGARVAPSSKNAGNGSCFACGRRAPTAIGVGLRQTFPTPLSL